MNSMVDRRELAAEVELLYTTYTEALDDGDVARWPDFFAGECRYRITTRENVQLGMPLCLVRCDGHAMMRDRAAALQKAAVYRHRFQRRIVSGLRLKTFDGVDRDGIEARASFVVFESVGDEPTRSLVSGCSSDVIVREGRALKFKERLCVIDARVIPDSLVFPV